MESRGLTERQQNPPNANRTLKHFVYPYTYATDIAYIMSPEQNESLRAFRKRTYTTLHTMALAIKEIRDMRVVKLHPDTHWTRVWHNLRVSWVSEELKAVWYTAIHDIIPTHDRLSKIRLRASNLQSIRSCGHHPTQIDGIHRRCCNMEEDTLPNSHHPMHRPCKCPTGMDRPPVLPVLAPTAPWGSIMDTCPHDILQTTTPSNI